MPTENEKTENLVDVGEADQQETEVNLDDTVSYTHLTLPTNREV